MSQYVQFFNDHQLALYIAFCTVVSTLPTPLESERWYGWLYNILHLASSNAAKVFPALRIKRNGEA